MILLHIYCHDEQHSWSRFLPWAEYTQNSLRQDTTGLTPFQCVLGFQPPLFPWMGEPSEVSAVDYWFWASEAVWNSADIHLQHAVRRHKTFADARRSDNPTYQPGDKVRLSTQDLHLRQPCRKLSAHYIGPLPVQKSPTYYNFHPGTAFTLPSTFPSLNHSFHLHQDPPSRRHLLLQKWPGMIYSILHCWRNSIISILIVLHPEAMAAPVAAQGC